MDITNVEKNLKAMDDDSLIAVVDNIADVTNDLDHIRFYNTREIDDLWADQDPDKISKMIDESEHFDWTDGFFSDITNGKIRTLSGVDYAAHLRKYIDEIAEAYVDNERRLNKI